MAAVALVARVPGDLVPGRAVVPLGNVHIIGHAVSFPRPYVLLIDARGFPAGGRTPSPCSATLHNSSSDRHSLPPRPSSPTVYAPRSVVPLAVSAPCSVTDWTSALLDFDAVRDVFQEDRHVPH